MVALQWSARKCSIRIYYIGARYRRAIILTRPSEISLARSRWRRRQMIAKYPPRARRIDNARGMDFAEFSSYRELCREFHADENASSGVTGEGAFLPLCVYPFHSLKQPEFMMNEVD